MLSKLCLALLLFPCLRSAYALDDLCVHGEESRVFACATANKKLISVCASLDVSETTGYFVYRFGTADGKVELQLPKNPKDFGKFTTGDELALVSRDEDDMLLRFRADPLSYVVYGGIGRNWEVNGVAVFRGEKLLSKVPCVVLPTAFGLPRNDQVRMGIPFEDDKVASRIWDQLRPKQGSKPLALRNQFSAPSISLPAVRAPGNGLVSSRLGHFK